MNHQPTELQCQAAAVSVLADLIRRAAVSGVPQHLTPTWCIVDDRITGQLRSDDDSALHALDAWFRRVLAVARIETVLQETPRGPRRVWSMATVVADVSVHLSASIPVAVAPRREAVPA